MARATILDALSEQTLTGAVSIGGSSATISADPGSYMPSGAGVFSVLITEGTIADSEVVNCTRSGTTLTLSGMTFTKAHGSGAVVKYVVSAADFANFGKLDATNTWALDQTFSGLIKGSGGTSLSTPPIQINSADADNGFRYATTNSWRAVAGGVDVLSYTSTSIATGSGVRLSLVGPFLFPVKRLSASSYTFSSTGENRVLVAARSGGTTINLPAFGGASGRSEYVLVDPYGYLGTGGDVIFAPYDDGGGPLDYGTINGAFANFTCNATGGVYYIFQNAEQLDPLTSGGTLFGDWTAVRIG